MARIIIEMTVEPAGDENVMKVIETLTRVATGFVLGGIDTDLSFEHWEDPTKEEEES